MEIERKKKEELQRNEERENLKRSGNPEDMTVRLLREVLDEIGEPYSRSMKKSVLIEKVRAARQRASNATCTASATTSSVQATGHESTTRESFDSSADSLTAKASTYSTSPSSRLGRVRKILQPTRFLYYFDEKKERVIHLLLLLLFIIDINNAYMESAVYVYVIHLLVSIQATLAFEELTFLFSMLLSLLLLLLTCFIFAHVNVNSFCSYSVYGDIYYVPAC